jgi:septal ring factor EnvC (AmiA/AmiB activator)
MSDRIEQFTAVAAALGVGGLLKGLFDWWRDRQTKQALEPAAMLSASAEYQGAVRGEVRDLLKSYREELRDVRGRCDSLETKVDACEERHAECEGAVRTLTGRLDESERDRSALKTAIDRLLAERPPATYGPAPLSGVMPSKP